MRSSLHKEEGLEMDHVRVSLTAPSALWHQSLDLAFQSSAMSMSSFGALIDIDGARLKKNRIVKSPTAKELIA